MNAVTLMSDEELGRLGSEPSGFGVLETARGRLPLTALEVTADVVVLSASIELAQTFQNTLDEPLEATYIFPLPDRAAVRRFQMEVGGRVIEGVIEERGRARADYESAIAQGHRAAIAEEDRAGVFTLRVGNILPRETAVVRLSLVGPVSFDTGEATFVFPLVVAPRYIPGVGLPGPQAGTGVGADTDAVPDASRITPPLLLPGFPNPVQLSIAVTVDGGELPVSALRSSLHVTASHAVQGKQHVQLQPGERLNRDFILRWQLGDAEIRSSAVLVADPEGSEATCLLTLVPPPLDAASSRPRDVVFVLDRSGSMQGWKMVAARRAVARMIDTLAARDRFAVLAFDDHIDTPSTLPSNTLVAASNRQRFRAIEFLAQVGARGGTELLAPLVVGAELLRNTDAERERALILVTDGQVGNEDQILREMAPLLHDVRVFALGIDTAVNAAFLRRLAVMGGGASELVESEERLDEVMANVHRRIAQPVVRDLRLEAQGLTLQTDSMAPARLPDLFAGVPLSIALRVTHAARGSITIHGQTPAGRAWTQQVSLKSGHDPAAAALWARAHIRDLEDRYAMGSSEPEMLEQRIVAVSLRHRVLSRFTAFLAVDHSARANPDGSPRMLTQPVELPDGWNRPGAGRTLAAAPAPVCAAAPPMKGAASTLAELGDQTRARSRKMSSFDPRSLSKPIGRSGVRADEPPVDLAPYLERVQEVATTIEAAGGRKAGNALDLALARLHELIEDLRSVAGGANGLLAELLRTAHELQRLLDTKPDLVELARRGAAELREIVRTFTGPARPPGEPRPNAERTSRWQFWKH